MRNRQGFILITVLLVMVVVALLVVGTAFTTLVNRGITANQQGSTDAYYVAKAGAEKYKTVVFQTYRYYLGHLDKYRSNNDLKDNSACGNFLRIGLDLNRDGDLDDSVDLSAEDLKNSRTLGPFGEGNGSYEITFKANEQYLTLISVGRVGRSRSTVQLVLEARNVSPMSNALFVGAGQSGNIITGGVNIYGSAYLTGNEATFKDSNPNNDYIFDENSSFAVHNFYEKPTLTNLFKDNTNAKIEDFLKTNFHVQRNLCSTLRVENARVKVGNKVNLGDASAGSDYKATLSGVHVSTNYSNDVKLTGNTSVYADLKTKLDVEENDFPALDTDSLGEGAGLLIENAGTGLCNVSGTLFEFKDTDMDCLVKDVSNNPVAGFKYSYDSDSEIGTLEVFGLVNFRGLNLQFKKNIKVQVDGEATFFVEDGDVKIDGDLLPSDSFPYQKDVLGIIAEKRLELTGAQQQLVKGTPKGQIVAGVFYAGEEADIAAGATVFGSVITKKLCVAGCTANEEANFVKIPDLEYNLPPGFSQLADATVPTFRVASFERR